MKLFLKDVDKWEAMKARLSKALEKEPTVDLKLDLARRTGEIDFVGILGFDGCVYDEPVVWKTDKDCLSWIADELNCVWALCFDPARPSDTIIRFKAVETL